MKKILKSIILLGGALLIFSDINGMEEETKKEEQPNCSVIQASILNQADTLYEQSELIDCPFRLNFNDLEQLAKYGYLKSNALTLLFAAANSVTNSAFPLGDTAYLKTIIKDAPQPVCAYLLSVKKSGSFLSCEFNVEETKDAPENPDVTTYSDNVNELKQSFDREFNKACTQAKPKELSEIKIKSGGNPVIEKSSPITLVNPLSLCVHYRFYRILRAPIEGESPDYDNYLGHFALVLLKNNHNIDKKFYTQMLRQHMSKIHQDIVKVINKLHYVGIAEEANGYPTT